MVKFLTAMRETRVLALGWDDPLEKETDKPYPDAGCPPRKPYDKPPVFKGQGMKQMLNL